MSLNAIDLRHNPEKTIQEFLNFKRFKINIVLDNLYDTYNIGSAFRIADGINAQKVIICGLDSAKPPEKQIRKSSMCICDYFAWESYSHIEDFLNRSNGINLVIEKTENSSNYRNYCDKLVKKAVEFDREINIIVGNETKGVNPIAFNHGKVLHIPMYGLNNSMNVINALTVIGNEVAYYYEQSTTQNL